MKFCNLIFLIAFLTQPVFAFSGNQNKTESNDTGFAPNYLNNASKIFDSEEIDIIWSKEQLNNYRELFSEQVEQKINAELLSIVCHTSVCKLEFRNLNSKATKLKLDKITSIIYSQTVSDKFYTQSEAFGKNPNLRVIYIADASRHQQVH